MIQENDKFQISTKYREMSISELRKEKDRVLGEINSKPRNIKAKHNNTKIKFNF